MNNGKSEIDDDKFFLSSVGNIDAKAELDASIDALLNESRFDDNSTACTFPARKAWLKEQLKIKDFPDVQCNEYNKILKRLDPTSATIVFPSAHINSPASMFGHTFLRINSSYNSKLLSYAVNYAADANTETENGVIFAIKGLFGGYYGQYSLLPYYEKLKEYRDSEQRDIWEYNLNLNKEEILKMVRHIWELNNTYSNYYFFTENCSYNMLWLIELARPSVHLREHFNYQVAPLETIHISKEENLLKNSTYRASKRTVLLKYEKLINTSYINIPQKLIESKIDIKTVLNDNSIETQQKMYLIEASIELLEYTFSKKGISKEKYLSLFHNFSKARASLGSGKELDIKIPANPLHSHRALRVTAGIGSRESDTISFLGIRPVFHDLEDNNYGFMRGTQIEFLNAELSYSDSKLEVEKATLISIVSLAPRSDFFKSFSWRTKFAFDRDSLDNKTNFVSTVGAGFSWQNDLGILYTMLDPLFYIQGGFKSAIGTSLGIILDKNKFTSTNLELTRRWYDTGDQQWLIKGSQNFRTSQNTQIKFNYDYKERVNINSKNKEITYKLSLNYYF